MEAFAGLQKIVPKRGGVAKEAFIFHFELDPSEERFLSFNSVVLCLLCRERNTALRIAFKDETAEDPFQKVASHLLTLSAELMHTLLTTDLWLARYGLDAEGKLRVKHFSLHSLFPFPVMESGSYVALGDVDALLNLSSFLEGEN